MQFQISLLVFVLFFLRYNLCISSTDILEHFKYKDCIPGTLLSISETDKDPSRNLMSKGADKSLEEFYNFGHSETEKSAMSSINELAQYNSITYSYELIKEQGSPHNKMFTITLYLGDEQYSAENTSLKKAQQDAAFIALKNTQYEHPPVKIKENEKPPTPTILLNNLAAKLGVQVTYTVVTDLLEDLNSQKQVDMKPAKSYLQKINDTVHLNDSIHIRKDGSDPKGPFTVRVGVNGEQFYYGQAHTIKNAKHEAAVKALRGFKDNQENFRCLKEGDNCKSKKHSAKSLISQVYEAAQKRNLISTFDIIHEEGPSHKKTFTTKCTCGDLEATGSGSSKKNSKQICAENMLPMLLAVPEAPSSTNQPETVTKKSKKKNKVIKTTMDKIDRMLDDAVDFGKGLIDKIRGGGDEDSAGPKKHDKHQKSHRSATDEIVQLGHILNLDVKYTDFENGGKMYALLEMGTKPAFMCLGEGIREKNSRDLASRYGIKTLYNLGLLDGLLDKSMSISNILDKEGSQKYWLELVEADEPKQEL